MERSLYICEPTSIRKEVIYYACLKALVTDSRFERETLAKETNMIPFH